MNVKLKQDQKIKLNRSEKVYAIMQRIFMRENKTERNREHFWTISLDTANHIVNIELVSLGTVKSTLVEPMEVLSIPLQKKAVSIVLVHNHPSGQLFPSEGDRDVTDHLIQACRIMGITITDHLIITETDYYSFADTGLLEELEQSTKYMLPYELKERYHKAGLEQGAKKGEKERAKEIARTMKSKGAPVELIMEYTGLSKASIVKLNTE